MTLTLASESIPDYGNGSATTYTATMLGDSREGIRGGARTGGGSDSGTCGGSDPARHFREFFGSGYLWLKNFRLALLRLLVTAAVGIVGRGIGDGKTEDD